MRRTILLSVMVFLLLIWKGNARFAEKFEPDISSDPIASELLLSPLSAFSFKATTHPMLFGKEKQFGYLNTGSNMNKETAWSNLCAPLTMLFFNEQKPVTVTNFLNRVLLDTYLYGFTDRIFYKQLC